MSLENIKKLIDNINKNIIEQGGHNCQDLIDWRNVIFFCIRASFLDKITDGENPIAQALKHLKNARNEIMKSYPGTKESYFLDLENELKNLIVFYQSAEQNTSVTKDIHSPS